MTNCEHLIENALTSMQEAKKANMDTYKSFQDKMSLHHNKIMLDEASITKDELWEIAQYILYTWEA